MVSNRSNKSDWHNKTFLLIQCSVITHERRCIFSHHTWKLKCLMLLLSVFTTVYNNNKKTVFDIYEIQKWKLRFCVVNQISETADINLRTINVWIIKLCRIIFYNCMYLSVYSLDIWKHCDKFNIRFLFLYLHFFFNIIMLDHVSWWDTNFLWHFLQKHETLLFYKKIMTSNILLKKLLKICFSW